MKTESYSNYTSGNKIFNSSHHVCPVKEKIFLLKSVLIMTNLKHKINISIIVNGKEVSSLLASPGFVHSCKLLILWDWTSYRHLSWGPSLSMHIPQKLGIPIFAQVLTPTVITNITIISQSNVQYSGSVVLYLRLVSLCPLIPKHCNPRQTRVSEKHHSFGGKFGLE